MKPRNRRLRLRKSTVRGLNPSDASQAQGAQLIPSVSYLFKGCCEIQTKPASEWCATINYTNCLDCIDPTNWWSHCQCPV